MNENVILILGTGLTMLKFAFYYSDKVLCNHFANKFVSRMLKTGTFLQFFSIVPHVRKVCPQESPCLDCVCCVCSVSAPCLLDCAGCGVASSRLSRQQIAVFHGGVLSY